MIRDGHLENPSGNLLILGMGLSIQYYALLMIVFELRVVLLFVSKKGIFFLINIIRDELS